MRTWMVIPAMGVAAAIFVTALGGEVVAALAMGIAGAALVAAVRMLVTTGHNTPADRSAVDSPAALVGAGVAAMLAAALLRDAGVLGAREALAIAAMAWTLAELARPIGTVPPLVAMAPATLAAVLDPAFVVLVAIAGARAVTALRPRKPWVIALPIVGGLAIVAAVIAGAAVHGSAARLAAHWFGHGRHAHSSGVLARAADVLGPLAAVATLVGVANLARVRLAELAVCGCAVGALLVDLRAGTTGAATLGVAALLSGLAVVRLATPIRITSVQAIVGITAGVLLVVPPAWSVSVAGPRPALARTANPPHRHPAALRATSR